MMRFITSERERERNRETKTERERESSIDKHTLRQPKGVLLF